MPPVLLNRQRCPFDGFGNWIAGDAFNGRWALMGTVANVELGAVQRAGEKRSAQASFGKLSIAMRAVVGDGVQRARHSADNDSMRPQLSEHLHLVVGQRREIAEFYCSFVHRLHLRFLGTLPRRVAAMDSNSDTLWAINHALGMYCRGIDRLDAALVLSAFHPGAILINYRPEPLTIELFAQGAMASLEKRFTATQHRISNVNAEIIGDSAKVETYVLAYHVEASEGGPRLHTFNGRYIDRFERRNDEWKIAMRTLRCDWTRIETIDEPMPGAWVASGRAGSPDPLDD